MATRRRSEIQEIQDQLAGANMQEKKAGIRKIIDAMTRGKDVSMLFTDIVKNMNTTDMEFKKLIYLYIINYAKTHPDLAILAINSFRKDSRDKTNPLLRALAVRTMGCIRVKQITEYLIDPLKAALQDEDSYVRKTAAICVAKLYDVAPDLLEEQGFVKILCSMLNDGNAFVLSNNLAALGQIQETKGEKIYELNPNLVNKLLTALSDCSEWGQIYILDALSQYSPNDSRETENILERVSPQLSHGNSGVVISSIRVVVKYLDYLNEPDVIRNYCRRLSAPLITLMGSENEIQFVVLKNINIILQKRPSILEKELKIFFCNFNDPIYIKLEKLDVVVRLSNMENIQQILHELKDYTTEVDVEFVKKSVRAIGRCAIKLEKAAEKCVHVLWECLRSKINFVVQESIIVIRDIFRKYPKKYEAILRDLCENLKSLDDPEAKSSMIWIVGEYAETIDNADELLENFMENFKEEPPIVQNQILTSCVKLFLLRPNDGHQLVQKLLQMVTEECENPDLRDRGFIYWRLLHVDPELAKRIVFAERPIISDQSYTIDSNLLETLIDNIGTLSSVYYKPPEAFVKKLRDIQNQREKDEQEEEPEELLTQDQRALNTISLESTNLNNDLDLLNDSDDENQYEKDQPKQQQNQEAVQNFNNITIPYSSLLSKDTQGQKQQSGVQIEGAVQNENGIIFLYLKVTNFNQATLNNIGLKVNLNPFKLQPVSIEYSNQIINPNQTVILKKELQVNPNIPSDPNPPQFPFKLQIAFNVGIDIFMFQCPCSLSTLIMSSQALSSQEYQEFNQSAQVARKQDQISCKLDNISLKQKFNFNMINLVGVRTNPQGIEMCSFSLKLINNMTVCFDTILDTQNQILKLNMVAPHPTILPLLYQAVGFITNL